MRSIALSKSSLAILKPRGSARPSARSTRGKCLCFTMRHGPCMNNSSIMSHMSIAGVQTLVFYSIIQPPSQFAWMVCFNATCKWVLLYEHAAWEIVCNVMCHMYENYEIRGVGNNFVIVRRWQGTIVLQTNWFSTFDNRDHGGVNLHLLFRVSFSSAQFSHWDNYLVGNFIQSLFRDSFSSAKFSHRVNYSDDNFVQLGIRQVIFTEIDKYTAIDSWRTASTLWCGHSLLADNRKTMSVKRGSLAKQVA